MTAAIIMALLAPVLARYDVPLIMVQSKQATTFRPLMRKFIVLLIVTRLARDNQIKSIIGPSARNRNNMIDMILRVKFLAAIVTLAFLPLDLFCYLVRSMIAFCFPLSGPSSMGLCPPLLRVTCIPLSLSFKQLIASFSITLLIVLPLLILEASEIHLIAFPFAARLTLFLRIPCIIGFIAFLATRAYSVSCSWVPRKVLWSRWLPLQALFALFLRSHQRKGTKTMHAPKQVRANSTRRREVITCFLMRLKIVSGSRKVIFAFTALFLGYTGIHSLGNLLAITPLGYIQYLQGQRIITPVFYHAPTF